VLLPRNAPVWLDRLSTWLEPFEDCRGHVAQRGAFRRYLLGLLSDSRRKSIGGMLARVSTPDSCEAFQHCITEAPWAAEDVWRRLSATMPDREGVLILDGTSFPKQGRHSVGVARQYCGKLGKIANCQDGGDRALWTGARAWMLCASSYLPDAWLPPDQRQRARIPATVRFQKKWRLAFPLLRQVRTSGIHVTAVLGDAEFGDNATLRRTLHRAKVSYALGVSSMLTVFKGHPAIDGAGAARGQGPATYAAALGAGCGEPRGQCARRGATRQGVANRHMAQRDKCAVARSLLRATGHAGARLAGAPRDPRSARRQLNLPPGKSS